ncbi:MAG: O-antigen ligase family protein [Clostridia bacterium]
MVLNAFIFTAVLSGLTSVFQIVKLSFLGYRLDSTVRIDSFLENSNNLGAYTVLSFFIVLMFIIKSKNKSSKIFFGFLLILLLASIISCQSRNALIGLLIGSFLIAALYDKRFILLSIILPIPLFLIPQSRLRILQIFDSSQNSSRFQIWESAKMMIKDNPIFGIGYNNFEVNYPIYVANNENLFISEGYLPLHPHNIFLNIQAELGILGTISFILFISITIFTLLKLIRLHTDNNINGILIGITCGFISLQFMNLIDNFYNAPKVALSMFVILAVANYHKIHWYNR